jgi:polysaccharide deacetylase 2 family uncharacterized protein YibQ
MNRVDGLNVIFVKNPKAFRKFVMALLPGFVGLGLAFTLAGCVTRTPSPARPRLAIVLDDAGNENGFYGEIYVLPRPVTLAIIPNTPWAATVLRQARQHRMDTIGHIPMQSSVTNEPFVVTTNMTAVEIFEGLTAAIDSLPGIKGINNHMGSLASADRQTLEPVMAVLKAKHMFIVDSRTTRDSQIFKTAQDWEIPCLAKDDFLDSEAGEERIRKHLRYLLSVARKRGYAVGIGHVQNLETILVLNDFMREHANDVEFVGISQLIQAD